MRAEIRDAGSARLRGRARRARRGGARSRSTARPIACGAPAFHPRQPRPTQEGLVARVRSLYSDGGLAPPWSHELAARVGAPASEASAALEILVRRGDVVRVKPDLCFDRPAVDALAARLRAHLTAAARDHRAAMEGAERRHAQVRHPAGRALRRRKADPARGRRAPPAASEGVADADAEKERVEEAGLDLRLPALRVSGRRKSMPTNTLTIGNHRQHVAARDLVLERRDRRADAVGAGDALRVALAEVADVGVGAVVR